MTNSDSSLFLPASAGARTLQPSPYTMPSHFSATSLNSVGARLAGSATDTQSLVRESSNASLLRAEARLNHVAHGPSSTISDNYSLSMSGEYMSPSTRLTAPSSHSTGSSAAMAASSNHLSGVAAQASSAPVTRRSSAAALSNSANLAMQLVGPSQGQPQPSSSSITAKPTQKPISTYYASRQWAFKHAESDWAKYNWHVRSGGRYIMTERAHRRYFACDHPDCPAVLYEDSPVEPKTGEAIKGGEMRMTLQKEHNHNPPEHGKPCNELMLRASLLLKTLSPTQVRDQLIAEAGNGIGIPSLDVIMQIVEKTRIIRKGKRGHHHTHHLPTPRASSTSHQHNPQHNHHHHHDSRCRHSHHDHRH